MRNDNPPIPNRDSGHRGGVVAALLGAALLLSATSQWLGCTPQKHYKVLSFFFDGVPDPNAPPEGELDAESATSGRPVPRAILHKPFAENKCDACHTSASGRFQDFDKADDSSCAKCHEHVQTQFAVMHGPVAIGGCSFCHVPHESSIPALLIDTAPAVCLTCHDRELLPATPADHATDRSCLDCHVGHGSDKRGLLRADWSASAAPSTTAPSVGSGGGQ